MTIPYSETFSTSAMNRVFDDKTASYKFYWFLSLLDMHVKEKRDEMLALEVAARMVAYAWYPIEYFHLLFGKGDQMEDVIKNISVAGINLIDHESYFSRRASLQFRLTENT